LPKLLQNSTRKSGNHPFNNALEIVQRSLPNDMGIIEFAINDGALPQVSPHGNIRPRSQEFDCWAAQTLAHHKSILEAAGEHA